MEPVGATSLKRSLEDEEEDITTGEPGKKLKGVEGDAVAEESIEIRVLIDNFEASVVIGKAGANVKQVRLESGAFVSILKSEAGAVKEKERVMTIKGTTEAVLKAMHLIVTLLADSAKARAETQGMPQEGVSNGGLDYSIKLLIHKFLAGAIIGKAGVIIREIMETTGARINLSNEPLATSTEKSVTIGGMPLQINGCLARVLKQLADNPLRPGSSIIPYTPEMGSQASAQAAAQAVAQHYPGYGTPPGHPGAYGAPPGAMGYGAPPKGPNPGYGAPPGQYGAPAYGAPAGYPGYGAPVAAGPSKTEKIVIPTVCAGSIIGKGGVIIKDIKAQSQTVVTIADPAPTAPADRVVTIIGQPQGIQTAIYMIKQRVEAYTPPNTTA